SEILRSDEQGDVRSASKRYGELIRKRLSNNKTSDRGLLLLAGGEFTVKVSGKGEGGRVQEFLLALLPELKDISTPFLIAGAGTDGRDGMTDAAGAWIDENTFRLSGSDPKTVISLYLENNDSYNYFKKLDQLIYTGPTGTNVMDIFLFFLD
ncbi:MAG: glycerate kinase, partial [Candidatus Aminicenantes bacterium]|nr:glycerate kinase [Candidatus Aminicenantes bacterium]